MAESRKHKKTSLVDFIIDLMHISSEKASPKCEDIGNSDYKMFFKSDFIRYFLEYLRMYQIKFEMYPRHIQLVTWYLPHILTKKCAIVVQYDRCPDSLRDIAMTDIVLSTGVDSILILLEASREGRYTIYLYSNERVSESLREEVRYVGPYMDVMKDEDYINAVKLNYITPVKYYDTSEGRLLTLEGKRVEKELFDREPGMEELRNEWMTKLLIWNDVLNAEDALDKILDDISAKDKAKQSSKPGASSSQPGPSSPQPGTSTYYPRPSSPQPGPSAYYSGPSSPQPGPSAYYSGPSSPQPGPSAYYSGPSSPQPGPSAYYSGPSSPQPGPSAYYSGPSSPQPGPSAYYSGPSSPQPGPSYLEDHYYCQPSAAYSTTTGGQSGCSPSKKGKGPASKVKKSGDESHGQRHFHPYDSPVKSKSKSPGLIKSSSKSCPKVKPSSPDVSSEPYVDTSSREGSPIKLQKTVPFPLDTPQLTSPEKYGDLGSPSKRGSGAGKVTPKKLQKILPYPSFTLQIVSPGAVGGVGGSPRPRRGTPKKIPKSPIVSPDKHVAEGRSKARAGPKEVTPKKLQKIAPYPAEVPQINPEKCGVVTRSASARKGTPKKMVRTPPSHPADAGSPTELGAVGGGSGNPSQTITPKKKIRYPMEMAELGFTPEHYEGKASEFLHPKSPRTIPLLQKLHQDHPYSSLMAQGGHAQGHPRGSTPGKKEAPYVRLYCSPKKTPVKRPPQPSPKPPKLQLVEVQPCLEPLENPQDQNQEPREHIFAPGAFQAPSKDFKYAWNEYLNPIDIENNHGYYDNYYHGCYDNYYNQPLLLENLSLRSLALSDTSVPLIKDDELLGDFLEGDEPAGDEERKEGEGQ